jgi:NAD(P)-dependent dehydrogenase (short-subunit alcohol dehydrogenase family)
VTDSLKGQVAIVTGGAGGIGQAYCRALGQEGASVVVADLNDDGAKAFAKQMGQEGIEAIGLGVDVTDPKSTQEMADAAVEAYGGIDILVNNAGIMSAIPTKGSLLEVTPDSWDLAMRVNAMSVLMCAKAVVPYMRERGGGKIINQSSTAAFEPGGLYRISKHAVVALTAGLGAQLGPDNINVNGIAPGMIQTEEGFRSAGAVGSDKRTARSKGVPNPRPDREPDALVGALLLLASPAGDYMNGQTLILDGGRNMRL